MEKTQLVTAVSMKISKNLIDVKNIVDKQTHIFGNLLINKIMESHKKFDKEKIQEVFSNIFEAKIKDEIDALFRLFQDSELDFYGKNLKTADLIFNTLSDKRTQTIYLENLIKKINQNEQDLDFIFTESAKKRVFEMSTDAVKEVPEEYLSINEMFEQFDYIVTKNSHLSIDEAADLHILLNQYFSKYKHDVIAVINQFFDKNKLISVTHIEDEMDRKEIRNGKTSAISKLEKSITNNSLTVMEQLLLKTVAKYKKSAESELKVCSSVVVALIFKLLPIEYKDQKDLLEIIVDTNINERLGKLLATETKKITANLQAKNQDKIENELYQEKRYKPIKDYECDFDLVEKVYQDVLYEIRIAYDIPEEKLKRLCLIVLSESNSTKNVFKNLITCIKTENEKNLLAVLADMNLLSEKAYVNGYISGQTDSVPKM